MAEAPGALPARRYEMTPAVSVEKRLLFAGQPAGPLAVKVHHAIAVAFDGVRRRDHLGASVAGRLGRHWSQQKVARAAELVLRTGRTIPGGGGGELSGVFRDSLPPTTA